MKFLIKLIFSLFIFAVAGAGVLAYVGYTHFRMPSSIPSEKLVTVPKGAGTLAIAEQLKRLA